MSPVERLYNRLGRSIRTLHQGRLKAIMAAVEAVLSGAPVTITSMGRRIGNAALPKP